MPPHANRERDFGENSPTIPHENRGNWGDPVGETQPWQWIDALVQHPLLDVLTIPLTWRRSSPGMEPRMSFDPVTELARPHAELVSAVDAGERFAAGRKLVAGENLQRLG